MLSIETKKLTKKYNDKAVVKDMNLKIEEGELFALLGTNGAGKTTTIKMLSTLILPTDGEIKISVLDIIKAFEKANGIKINYKIVERRPGDIAECYADPTKAREELNWVAEKTLEDMCRDAWNYVSKNN